MNTRSFQNDMRTFKTKYDKTAYAAIQQIKERHYMQALEGYVERYCSWEQTRRTRGW